MQAQESKQRGTFISWQIRLLIAFSVIFTVFFVAAFAWFYWYASNAAMDDISSELYARLETGAASIDGDELLEMYEDNLDSVDDYPDEPRFWEHAEWLSVVGGEESYGWAYTYMGTGQPDEVIFIGCSGALYDPPEGPWFGERYVAGDDEQIAAGLSRIVIEDYLIEDEWGDWLSGYAPIYNEDGEAVAALGIDISADYVWEVQTQIQTTVAIVFVVTYIPLLVAVLLVSRAMTRPIVRVTQAAREIAQGKYEQDLSAIHQVRLRHEISELAEAIEESGRVHIREKQLKAEVAELKIQIDEEKRKRHVDEIVEGEFFQDLQAKARQMRSRRSGEESGGKENG